MPDFNDLPNELMVETFSYFDIKDLVRCMRVNKSFKAITEHSAFDKIFFRTKAIEPNESMDINKLKINPALSRMHYTCRSKIKDASFLFRDEKPDGKSDIRELALTDSSAAKQNATEPAVTRLYLRPYGGDHIKVKSEHAVTVQDVMQGLCDYYEPGAPYDRCHYFFEGFHKHKASTRKKLVLEAYWGS